MGIEDFDFDGAVLPEDDDFEDDDDFDFDDDDDFEDDDDSGDGDDFDDGFGFDDDEDDDDFDSDDFEDDDDDFDDFGTTSGGPSRAFIMAVLAMMAVFVCAIGLVLVLVLTEDTGLTENQQLATQIAMENGQTMEAYSQSQTQQAIERTEEAIAAQQTQVAEEEAAVLQLTQDAVDALAAAEELAMTQTAAAEMALTESAPEPTEAVATEVLTELEVSQTEWAQQTLAAMPEPTEVEQTPELGDAVALTATAIVAGLGTPRAAPGDATPTPESIGGPDVDPTATPRASTLADTGLFDDVGGGNSFAMMIVLAFSLIGLIVGARILRLANANSRP